MGNIINFKNCVLFALTFFIGSCGRNLPVTTVESPEAEQGLEIGELTGSFSLLGGGEINLAQQTDPTVLIFASDTCSVCLKEARTLVRLFNENNGLPINVSIIHLLIGGVIADAKDWVNALNIEWPVGIQPGDSLFRQYCPEARTPCVITHDPATKKTKKFIGESSIKQWEKETGKWEF